MMLDESVPDGIGKAIEAARYEVIYHRDVLLEGVSDDVVCAMAMENDAVLVAVDNDMKRLARQYTRPLSADRFKRLSYVGVGCKVPQQINRMRQALPLIAFEWEHSELKAARRLWIEIGPDYIRTNR